jgi:RNA chaperone Hfq
MKTQETSRQRSQEAFLLQLCERRTPVLVRLLDGTSHEGLIAWFDQFSVLLLVGSTPQQFDKRSIATIRPYAAGKAKFRGHALPARDNTRRTTQVLVKKKRYAVGYSGRALHGDRDAPET